MTDTIQLAKALISIESVTPNDNGCLDLIAQRLEPRGFKTEPVSYKQLTLPTTPYV